mgnify:CR=1 FL=1
MTDATANSIDQPSEQLADDRARNFLVAATWSAAAFAIGLSVVLSVWLAIEHLPENFLWDLVTG